MAIYFYDHSVGERITHDSAGAVCRDDDAAMRNGWLELSRLLSDHEKILPWQHFELIIRREDGVNVGRLGMTVVVETRNPATAVATALQKHEPGGMNGAG